LFKPRLLLRIFAVVSAAVAAASLAIYLSSAPLMKRTAYEIELGAGRTILDNVFEMANRMHFNLEAQRAQAVEWHKRQIKNIVSLASAYVEYTFARVDAGEIDEAEARRLVYAGVRQFTYGNDDYVWITDYNGVLVSHADPAYQGRDASDLRDPAGVAILPTIIDIARRRGEGFHEYTWTRLGQKTPRYKLSYFRNFPRWGLVVGSGVYLDDIETEVARRKAAAVEELRNALRSVRIARTGYVYIFDAENYMIIHPNPNIEGTLFGELLNPVDGKPIAQVLREAADSEKPISYKWDKPSDPGNYTYDKLSWVRHFDGFDWYIASSVYVEELRRSSDLLGWRILGVGAAAVLAASGLGYLLARLLISPLKQLAETAERVQAGDLSAESGLKRSDEIGLLAHAFDGMIRRLRENIAMLDSRVRARTNELESAQTALSEVEARQRLILDAIPAAIAYADRDGRLRFVNDGWSRMVERPKPALIGHELIKTVGTRAGGMIAPYVAACLGGRQVDFEYAYISRVGRRSVTKNAMIPEMAGDGAVIGLFVLSLDVTDEKETQRQLLEAQRLKAVGQLSGGLAHDFNNLLSVIIGNLNRAQEKFADVPGLERFLAPAERAGRRGADITARLLAFSRRQPLTPAAVDVGALVGETALLLQRSLPQSIVVTTQIDPAQPCRAFVDQNQLVNALVNLGLNARDAMPDGGRLTLSARARAAAEGEIFDEPTQAGSYAEIRIADDGCGFSPGALRRAFEPFFTTKTQGSGLGLSMVYGFVKQSGGYIRIDSRPGETVAVLLLPSPNFPASEPQGAAADLGMIAAPARTPRWSGQLVLLVEDDDDVRDAMRGQLQDLGFSVVEACSGDEAADILGALDDLVLVVSDVAMPGRLNGLGLAELVEKTRPKVGVVLVSGFTETASGGRSVLRKPWDKTDLVDAIRHSLRHAASP
jgi:two-component system, cell cycle sensor histidine kinase and response regulator CckA